MGGFALLRREHEEGTASPALWSTLQMEARGEKVKCWRGTYVEKRERRQYMCIGEEGKQRKNELRTGETSRSGRNGGNFEKTPSIREGKEAKNRRGEI